MAEEENTLFQLGASIQDVNIIWWFSSLQSHRVQLSSQITDYWLENNTAIQDTISIQPVMITLQGLVGEVTYSRPNDWNEWFGNKLDDFAQTKWNITLTDKLKTIGGVLPEVDNYTQLAKNAVTIAESAYNRYSEMVKNLKNFKTNKIKSPFEVQQKTYENIQDCWRNKTALTVYTPYGEFPNMYIQNVDINQDNSKSQSNLSITLKQVIFKDIKTGKLKAETLARYNGSAQAEETNNGVQSSQLYKLAPDSLKKGSYRRPGK